VVWYLFKDIIDRRFLEKVLDAQVSLRCNTTFSPAGTL
jgi:hypothetical protein